MPGVSNPLPQGQFRDYWSDIDDLVTITNVASDIALPDVVIAGLPAGFSIQRVIAMLKYRIIEDNSALANAINTALADVQVRRGANPYIDAINLVDNQWQVAASSRDGGDVLVGDIDVSAEANGNVTINFQLNDIVVDGNNLLLRDVQTGLRVYFNA